MSAGGCERILVAGIGNVFLADDGFGSEVAQLLARGPIPPGVEVADIGIRGVHLAFQLLDGYDAAILIDTMPHGEPPGTVTVIEHVPGDRSGDPDDATVQRDAHGMQPDVVLSLLDDLGGEVPLVLIVGCEPAELEPRMGLSSVVESAVAPAAAAVLDLVTRLRSGTLVDRT